MLLMVLVRKVMLAAAAVALDRGGRVAVDGVLEALARPVKVVLWHLIHATAADVASSAAVWLIHHPDATGVMLPLAPRSLRVGGGARVDLPQSSVKLQFRCKPEREEREKKRVRWSGRMGEGKEITVMRRRARAGWTMSGLRERKLCIIGIDNRHNVSVSRMNAHFPICVVSPRGTGRAGKRRSHRDRAPSIPLFSSMSISVRAPVQSPT